MTCQRFERQVSDWLSRRLSPDKSGEMAAHETACASCRNAAQAETDLRRRFHEAAAPPVLPDLWPCLALFVEAEEARRTDNLRLPALLRFPSSLMRRCAVTAAFAVTALGACCWSHLSEDRAVPAQRTTAEEKTLPASALTASSAGSLTPVQTAAWTQIGRQTQDDPAVDDPVGPNMENIWTCLNTNSK